MFGVIFKDLLNHSNKFKLLSDVKFLHRLSPLFSRMVNNPAAKLDLEINRIIWVDLEVGSKYINYNDSFFKYIFNFGF